MALINAPFAKLARFIVAGAVMFAAIPALAQNERAISEVEHTIELLLENIEEVREDIDRPAITSNDLGAGRDKADELRQDALTGQAKLQEPLERARNRLAELGEAPKEGESEDELIAKRRKSLGDEVTRLEAMDKELSLLALQAGQLSSRAATKQREYFFDRIFEPTKPVLHPVLWYDGLLALPLFFDRLGNLVVTRGSEPASVWALAAIATLSTLGAMAIIWLWMFRSSTHHLVSVDAFYRLWCSVRLALYTGAIVAATYLAIALALGTLGSPPARAERLVIAIGYGVAFTLMAIALSRGIFRPAAPDLRLVNISDRSALKLHGLSVITATFYGIDIVVDRLAGIMFLPLGFTVTWNALVGILLTFSLAGFLLVSHRAEPLIDEQDDSAPRRFYFGWTGYVFHVCWLIVFIGAFALMTGYISLAQFVTSQLFLTGVVVAALYIIHHLTDATVTSSLQTHSRIGRFLRRTMMLGEAAISRLGVLISAAVDVAIVLVGLPIILLQWALTINDFHGWAITAFFGFKVGDVIIAPSSILLAILILTIGLVVARLFTMWLDRRILSRTISDTGVRDSTLAGARYASLILAVGLALTAAGVDFSNLAIIAGALGVGIGFGLQSIVNNFVSGLILLAERPIKVGDWISVSGGEGIVRQIKVRSTEIQTFDRCTVIVPNSSLISEPVSNWYHNDVTGRVRVAVGVSYDADPEQVREILLEVGRSHKQALRTPEPQVMFMNYGASSLDFELRVFIDDVAWVAVVGSDLRFAVFKALKAAGIEIPFPQTDLHVRSLSADAAGALAGKEA